VKILQSKTDPIAELAPELTGVAEEDGHSVGTDDGEAKETKRSQFASGWLARNWQLGAAFAGVILLTIAGAVTVKNLRSDAPASRDLISNPEATTVEPVAEPVSKLPSKAARARGAFQTVRPTQVFSGPSEESEPIVNIAKGTRVNVVDSRDGWLEIRSKHGRPPGFIRQETAVRTGSN
jgi:Bacterial SH3 domain